MQPAFSVIFLVAAMPLAGQWLHDPTPGIPRLADGSPNLSAKAPKLADGTPDLSGIWAAKCGIYDGSRCFVQSYYFDLAQDLPAGAVRMTPWAEGIARQRASRDHVDDPYGYCLPPGVPRIDFGGGPFKILQTPGVTAILYETLVGMIFRQVFTDGRPPASVDSPAWLGYSTGPGQAIRSSLIPAAFAMAAGSIRRKDTPAATPYMSSSDSAASTSGT